MAPPSYTAPRRGRPHPAAALLVLFAALVAFFAGAAPDETPTAVTGAPAAATVAAHGDDAPQADDGRLTAHLAVARTHSETAGKRLGSPPLPAGAAQAAQLPRPGAGDAPPAGAPRAASAEHAAAHHGRGPPPPPSS
ncbi:hypothetical protein STAL104432_26440 [Streptomyces albus]